MEARRESLLLLLLRARSIAVDAATQARIEACEDDEQLKRWAQRAVDAHTLADVFDA